MFAQVSFPISSFITFTYAIPPALNGQVRPGKCVIAPMRKQPHTGYVVSLAKTAGFKGKILEINSVHEEELHFPEELWQTLEWMASYYITPLGQVLKAALPQTFMREYKPREVRFIKINKEGLEQLEQMDERKPAQKRILSALALVDEAVKVSSLTEFASSPHAVCSSLEEHGWVDITIQPLITDPFDIMSPGEQNEITLSVEQERVFAEIQSAGDGFNPILMHGVTGSGKTEVYLKAAQAMVENGKSVLVLVPEISLTPQVANRFRLAFGSRVALWHSRMTKAEKGWTWQQLKKGAYSVVVGARSALFAPLQNLGLIIVDEEQESSYKQEAPAPRYHARDVALMRGKVAGAMVLLTSATPSLESYYNVLQKKLKLVKLTERYGKARYPSVELIDMKNERTEEGIPLFSKDLIQAMGERLAKKEQIILLQNRRGYALIQQCLDCGHLKMCQRCAVTLTYHRTDNRLHCHYCQLVEQITPVCGECKGSNIHFVGSGTQKVENVVMEQFPKARIFRMDIDTVRGRGAHQKILQRFGDGKADILLGTQMIAKGLDFANVTLVGVINADSGLFFPDFRAGERVFQLIYQVAGRAGRRDQPGQAIIQTYNPQDIFIQTASHLDIKKFYNISLAQRQELNYPPFSRIARILFSGKNKIQVNNTAAKIARKLYGRDNYRILGPTFAPIEKIQDNWRSHLIIKTLDKKSGNIHQYIQRTIGYDLFSKAAKGVRIQVDVDPVSMM